MLLSAVSVVVVAQTSSEIPEGLMNNSVYVSCSYVFVRLHHHHKLAFAVPKVRCNICCYFDLLSLISIFMNLLVILCHMIQVKARIDPIGCAV